jgi:hypothetical protein
MNWVDVLLLIVGSVFAGAWCLVQLLAWVSERSSPEGLDPPEKFLVMFISVILLVMAGVPYALVARHLFFGAA